jgi:hypothetical protein
METGSNSKTARGNCLKDNPDVEAVTVQEKKAEHISIVDLNSCEVTEEPELDVVVGKQKEIVIHTDGKKAVPIIGSERVVGLHRGRFCEKPTSLASNCYDNSLAEEISCVRYSYAESSKNTSLGQDFLPSGSSNCPSLMQGNFISLRSKYYCFVSVSSWYMPHS